MRLQGRQFRFIPRLARDYLAEKSLPSQPPFFSLGAFGSQPHRSVRGTCFMTCWTCCPHPAQVVFEHLRQVTARHIFVLQE
ncbi:hypothetical protein BLJ79_17275 [Arthrobacter sp. UCD-GKA]|nr:hypothetical protein BLJ79_17275 [Arthrobacter sp. UCD-GKA]